MKCEIVQPYIKSNNQRNKISFSQRIPNSIDNSVTNPNVNTKLSFGPVLSSVRIKTQIGNFYKVDDNFYRGAQPGIDESHGGAINYSQLKEDLKYLRDNFNISVILNLRNPNDNNTNHIELEKLAIRELNEEARLTNVENPLAPQISELEGINIPMYAEDIVRSEQVEEIMKNFQKYSDKNIFVHCRSGNDRTGVVTGLHRIWKYGTENELSFNDIRQEMISCGHNQNWYPRLISSLSACIRYMGITPDFNNIKNAKGEKNFLWTFYQNNRDLIKALAFRA